MEVKYFVGIFVIIILAFGSITLQWRFDKDWISLSRDGELIAREKWIVNAERTYINKNSWYRTNVICPRIIDDGGYETATRCYYADDTYEPLSRSLLRTTIELVNQTNSYLVRKSTPNYKYGTRGAYAGYLIEEMIFIETEQMEEFPHKYTVNWNPKDTRNYKLVWRIENLKQINLPDGTYHHCEYTFGNIKIDLKDECNKLEKAEVIGQSKIYFYFMNERGEQDFDLRLVDPTVYLSLEGFSQNISVELSTHINVSANLSDDTICIDVDHPDYGVNYSVGSNTTTFDLNITYLNQDQFNDSTTEKTLTSSGSIGITMDSRSDMKNTSIDIVSNGTVNGLSVFYGDTGESFNGGLQGEYLIDTEFEYGDAQYNETELTYTDAGSKYLYINMTEHPNSISFQLWGSDLDIGNDFSFTDYFENSTYIDNSSSTSEHPFWLWDDFSTDTRTDLYTTGSGTHAEDVDLTDQRFEGSCSSSRTCPNADSTTYNDADNSKMVVLLQNIDQYKRIEFYGYCYASAFCAIWAGAGWQSASGGSGTCSYVISSSSTLASYVTLTGSTASASAPCSGDDDWNSASTTTAGTYILERVQDTGSSFTFKIYKDGVYKGTTSALSGDINIGYVGSTAAYCKNVAASGCANCPTGSGSQNSRFDTIRYSGVGNNYTANLTYITNSTFESELLNTTANDIEAATLTITARIPTDCTTDYFLSNNNGTDWEEVYSGTRHVFSSVGKNLKWKTDLNCTITSDTPAIFEMKTEIISGSASNVSVDLGNDGTYDWYYNNTLNSTNSPQTVSLNLTPGNKDANHPIKITSGSLGIITVNNSVFNSSMNPLVLDETQFEDCNNCEINATFNGDAITLNNLQFNYWGGNKTYTVLAHDDSYSINTSYDITYYYSKWDYSFPSYVDYMEFIPKSPITKNVTPYGQDSTRPILNITNLGYGGKNANISIYLNESYSCVNLTVATSDNKTAGTLIINGTWNDLSTNTAYLSDSHWWMWADYQCNYSTWNLWEPLLSIRACCVGCICSESVS